MALQELDFVEISYTGSLDDGTIFDTTDEAVAKEQGLQSRRTYGPVTICLGKHMVLAGLENAIIGKDENTSFEVTLPAEQAFGKKDAKLIQLVPMSSFKKQNIQPTPGLQLNIDGSVARIVRVSGGRVLVDFNHPLAGKQVAYNVDIKSKVTDTAKQAAAMVETVLGAKVDAQVKDGKADIKAPADLPEPLQKMLGDTIKDTVKSITEVTFSKQ